MSKRNPDLVNISPEMRKHLEILKSVAEEYSGTEVYRLAGSRSNMVVLDYEGKRVCALTSDKKSTMYGTLGTRTPLESDRTSALEVRVGYGEDPEPESLTTRYRFRPNWAHPYTINFDSYDSIRPEVERLLKSAMGEWLRKLNHQSMYRCHRLRFLNWLMERFTIFVGIVMQNMRGHLDVLSVAN